MKYNTIIFDLDGTLLNTLNDIADAANAILKTYGFKTFHTEEYRQFVGRGVAPLFQTITPPGTTDEIVVKCCESFKQEYACNWHRKTCPYPKINDMLSCLSAGNVKLAVLSNKPHAFTVKYIDYFFPKGLFEIYLGQRDHVERKPAPDAVFEILSALQSTTEDTIYVGDSNIDMQTGVNSGVTAVGVGWGFRDVEELVESGANKIIYDPMELVEYAGLHF